MALSKQFGLSALLVVTLVSAGGAYSVAEETGLLPKWGASVAKSKDEAAKAAKPAQAAGAAKTAAGAAKKPASKPAASIETGALPAAQPVAAETFSDWVRECRDVNGAKRCSLRQTILDGKKRRIVEFRAARSAKTAFLEIRLPLGLSIPFGVSLDLSDKVKLPTQLVDCNAGGCRSVIALDDKTLAQLKDAKSLAVSFQDSKTGKIITISGSPKGFNDGLAKGIGAG
jgi:invasion protein IalB